MQSLPVGARLPSERKLAEQYGCNFLTVRRALKSLVDEGIVVRRAGSGTFLARHVSTNPGRSVERLGVLVWRAERAYSPRALQVLAHEAELGGVSLLAAGVTNLAKEGAEQAVRLAGEGCGAIILPWFPHDRVDEVRAFVRACPVPVSLPSPVPGLEHNSFEPLERFSRDIIEMVERLCGYFHALGLRRIALLGPDRPGDVVLNRIVGAYVCHTSRLNLPNFCGLVGPGEDAMERLARRWAELRGDLAVISYDDEHALRFMAAMGGVGLKAPEDFRIVGRDDTEAGPCGDPALSTVSKGFAHAGHWLVRNAIALAGGGRDQATASPTPRLFVRGSCGGAGRIDERLRQRLPGIDIVEE